MSATRVRRAEEKDAEGGGKTKGAKKATRKIDVKHATEMEIAQSKEAPSAVSAAVGVPIDAAEVKETAQNSQPASIADAAKDTEGKAKTTADFVPVMVEEVLSDMLNVVAGWP